MMARNFHFSAACVPLQKVVNKFAVFILGNSRTSLYLQGLMYITFKFREL